MKLDVEKLNFDRCEDEQIHIPESIQSYGYLFALNKKGQIEIFSENVRDLFEDSEGLLGTELFSLLDEDKDNLKFLQETYERAKATNTRLPFHMNFKKNILSEGHDRDFFAIVYHSDGYFVIELEPASKFREAYSTEHYIKLYSMSVAPKFKTYKSLGNMAQEIVDTIRYISGMERVVLYKFNDDMSGKVIAESKIDDPELESYLDLFYPASDIPAQARELYIKNWVRLTPNVDLEPSKLYPPPGKTGRKRLDMTHSLLRSMSPIHHQYIRNQGLKASFSLSLVTHDRLWGIVSCHSREPIYIPQNVRLQCENLSQLFSWHLFAKEEELFFNKKIKTDKAIDEMLSNVSAKKPIVDLFRQYEDEVLEIMGADGFVFVSDQEVVSIGEVPEMDVVYEMYEQSNRKEGKPYISRNISDQVSDTSKLDDNIGLLLIPLAERKNYFTAWFRKEEIETQRWAGAPDEKKASGSKKERLTPRTSFKIHVKEISGLSKEWDQNDVDMAWRFNRVFLAHALDLHEKMRENVNALEKQDRHKNEFLATLAHELRNPLSPISAGVSLLENIKDAQTQARVIETIKRQVGHMTKMINELMEVSRITQGKIKLDRQNVLLQDVIDGAVETCESLLNEKDHALAIDMPEEQICVNGDSTRLAQIFSNILNNAAKYTEPGGEISITAKQEGRWAVVAIKDNGHGIPKERQKDVFSMFTQVEASSTSTKGGLGIGLTLVERLVRLHGGTISVESEGPGKGSEFIVKLPCRMRVRQAVKGEEAPAKTAKANERKRILIVDDNPDVTSMYELLIGSMGYEAKSALSGKAAIALFKEFKPHCALLDIGMPDMDGYELCQALSALPEAKGTLFLSQSGWGSKKDIEKALASGFKEHFVKPLDQGTLEKVLQKYLSGSERSE